MARNKNAKKHQKQESLREANLRLQQQLQQLQNQQSQSKRRSRTHEHEHEHEEEFGDESDEFQGMAEDNDQGFEDGDDDESGREDNDEDDEEEEKPRRNSNSNSKRNRQSPTSGSDEDIHYDDDGHMSPVMGNSMSYSELVTVATHAKSRRDRKRLRHSQELVPIDGLAVEGFSGTFFLPGLEESDLIAPPSTSKKANPALKLAKDTLRETKYLTRTEIEALLEKNALAETTVEIFIKMFGNQRGAFSEKARRYLEDMGEDMRESLDTLKASKWENEEWKKAIKSLSLTTVSDRAFAFAVMSFHTQNAKLKSENDFQWAYNMYKGKFQAME